jgi:hypothetical protein
MVFGTYSSRHYRCFLASVEKWHLVMDQHLEYCNLRYGQIYAEVTLRYLIARGFRC